MITIKCNGRVTIEGDGTWPTGIKLLSSDEVVLNTQPEKIDFSLNYDITAFANLEEKQTE